ncbi:ThuA domain-containing protein [Dactylosporangium sp. NPDC051484]|uniref:ThuA domain-containing protein n=1 Tax=Dactylosporangium sp. NPDC051484 TaxID=3154942 RepID=UPI00345009A6
MPIIAAVLPLVAGAAVALPSAAHAAPVEAPPPAQQVPQANAAAGPFDVLVFSKTAGFRHDSIPAGITAIKALGAANNFTVDTTEDSAFFTDANLAKYEVVVWLSTTGDVLNAEQQGAFERYIKRGGGYAGVHAASDTEYDWPWYGELVGAWFNAHPASQQATIKVEDPAHPSTKNLPARWSRFDEWYNYRTNPRGKVHVLASVDETSYTPGTGAMGADHPFAWCRDYDGGRSWYTGAGHTQESFSDPQFLSHLLGGIQTAAGAVPSDCSASLTSSFEKIKLDGNTNNPMELAVAPDGRVFYIERDGRVQIVKPDTHKTVTAVTIPVFTGNEDGMLGLTLDPNFAQNHWVYLYYSPAAGPPRNILGRFTVTGDTIDPASEKQVLVVTTQRNTCCHEGGSMTFDSHGNLFLATGDNSNPFESSGYSPLDERAGRQDFDAQRTSANTNDLRGKLLRITPQADGTYTIPAGNLFPVGTAKTRPEVYAMGFRNPFRIGVDPLTDIVYVGDYGPDAPQADPNRGPGNTVEWNIVSQPGNFGWPYCTGANVPYRAYTFPSGPAGPAYNCAAPVNNSPNNTGLNNLPPAIPATVDYNYAGNAKFPEIGGGGAPMGGPVYRYNANNTAENKWPAYFDGKAIFGEWNQNKLYTMQVSADGKSLVDINQLLAGMKVIRPMDMEFGPDGALYIIEWGTGFGGNNSDSGVYRIDYVAGNRAPIAQASAQPTSGVAPLTVQFSSQGSRDPDGQSITYAWTFGDGGTSTEANPAHTYTSNGNFTAQLTVTDTGGRSGTANVPITVGNTAPTVKITLPPDGGFYEWGDQLKFTVEVTDPEDGQIDCSKVQVQYLLGHDEHAHPLEQYTGCSGTVQTSLASGHGAEANVFAVIEASYVDRGGPGGAAPLTGRSLIRLQPKRMQAEYFTATGRVPGVNSGGTPGVQRETTGDPQGGFQNIGFVEEGDWFSFTPVNLTGIDSLRIRAASNNASGGTIQIRTGSLNGPIVGSVAVPGTGGWQTYVNLNVPISASTTTGELFFIATGAGAGYNINWIDFIGRGVTDNAPPVVTATASPPSGTTPFTVTFTGSATDPDGDNPLTYAWDFGDGGTAATANATHTYTAPGNFTATLTVTDARGAKGTATVAVRAEAANTQCFGARSDDFLGSELDRTKWTVVRETQALSVSGGALHLPTAPGDLYGGTNGATNLVLQPAPAGAWQATTKVTLPAAANYQQAGLILYGDDDNYAKVDLLFATSRKIEFIRESAGTPRNEAADAINAQPGDTYYVRLISDGTNLTAAYSTDGTTFVPVGRAAALAGITNPRIGLYALNGGTTAPIVDAAFDWFQLSPDTAPTNVDPSDEFNSSTLDHCRWNAIVREDPTGYRLLNGALQIDVPNGDIYGTGNTAPKNFILQKAPNGDFTIETKVDGSAFNEQYQQGGLIVYVDDDNYVKIDYIVDNQPGQALVRRIEYRSEIGAAVQNPQPNVNNLTSAVWYFRIAKLGNAYTGSYSANGTTWTTAATLTNAAVGTNAKVGVYTLGAGQTASKPASFDYFRLTTAAVDTTPPVATATVQGTQAGGFYNGPVTVTLAATDTGSGVDKVEYQVDSATTWSTYSEPIPLSGDGTHQVRYRASDKAGNTSEPKVQEVKIDATAPVTTATFAPATDAGWHKGATPVALAATDSGSGVAGIQWSLDGGAWTSYTAPVNVTGDGQHELLYKATDAAGNVETLKSAILKIDATAPTVIVAGLADGQLYGDSQDVRVTWQAIDATSGVKSVAGSLDGGAYQTGTLQAMYQLSLGMHQLSVTGTDNAGNATTTTVTFFVTTSFRDMQNLLDRFKASSQLTSKAYNQLSDSLATVRKFEAKGNDAKALKELAAFRALITPALVPDAGIRSTLIRDADAMTIRLGGTPPDQAGVKANNGKSLAGTGRVDEDPSRLKKNGKL